MNCNSSDNLFMKYMDNNLTEKEALQLKEHMASCSKCNEEFIVYDKIMQEFSMMDMVNAPNGFEDRVMEQIRTLEPFSDKKSSIYDNFVYFVWGFISVVMGIGVLLMVYKEQIISFLDTNYNLGGIFLSLKPITEFTESFMTDIVFSISGIVSFTTTAITDFRFYLIGIIIFAGITQVIRTRFAREKE